MLCLINRQGYLFQRSTSSTDKYVLKYKYQVQVLYLTPTLPFTPFWAEVCRWSASLSGGSSCWRPNEVVVRGPRLTPPPLLQTATKMVRNQRPLRYHPFMSVTAHRSVDTCDDKVVSEYEED